MLAQAFGKLDPLQLFGGGLDERFVDDRSFLGERAQQCRVAQDVDEPRHAARVAKHDIAGRGLEDRSPIRAGDAQPMRDVLVRFALGEGAEMKAQPHALHQLREARRVELVRQLRLPGDDDAQQFFLLRLEPGQQAHLLEDLARQVLRLVDDEQDLLAGRVLLDHEVLDHRQQLDLLLAERLEAELDEQGLQKLDGRELRLADVREHDVARQTR